jgi:hypothetical protein
MNPEDIAMYLKVVSIFCLICWSHSTLAVEVDWRNSIPLSASSEFENPLVRLAFNPQPEPPDVLPALDLNNPVMPSLTIPYPPDDIHDFRILFGLRSETPNWTYEMLLPDGSEAPPDQSGHYEFFAIGPGGDLRVTMDITESNGSPLEFINWQGFNPQPEPPAFWDAQEAQSVGFDFELQMASLQANAGGQSGAGGVGTLSVAFQIFDLSEIPYEFSPLASADFDTDGDVDMVDLLAWQSAFTVDASGDANGDSDTDGNDFLHWQSQFDGGAGSAFQVEEFIPTIVPEPSGFLLIATAMIVCGLVQKNTC